MDHRPGALAAVARRGRALLLSGLLVAAAGHQGLAQPSPAGPAQDSTSLDDIVAREPGIDPWSLRVVSIRCTSFYITASAMERESRPALAIQYEVNAELFLARALALSREDKEILIGHLTRLSRMYFVLSQAARDSAGDPFDHPLLRADLDFCMRLARQS